MVTFPSSRRPSRRAPAAPVTSARAARVLGAWTALVLVALAPSPAHAICADTDGNGLTTVTDGVNVLRAAAGLGGGCSIATCDTDGDGRISLTDGVTVMRAANGLPHVCDTVLSTLTVPSGFRIGVYAADVPGARSLTLGPRGTVFVGTRQQGRVYALIDADGNQHAEHVVTIAQDLDSPNGVAVRDGSLYVAEISRVLRFDDIEDRLFDPPSPTVVRDDFPREASHGWKFIRFGPDGRLYVPVGVPCNVCESADPRFGTITRMQRDGGDFEIYAEGLRNSVGFDWHPDTGELWFTDNGRDRLGDDVPPDELNHAPRAGLHFGFPFCHGATIREPDLGPVPPCEEFEPPALELGPHVAALGMRFYTGDMFPGAFRGQVFIAEHGSNHRAVPIGYRVTLVRFEGGRPVSYEPFADGWLRGETARGRPVDVQVMPDGALLVSDDHAGVVYRVSHEE